MSFHLLTRMKTITTKLQLTGLSRRNHACKRCAHAPWIIQEGFVVTVLKLLVSGNSHRPLFKSEALLVS